MGQSCEYPITLWDVEVEAGLPTDLFQKHPTRTSSLLPTAESVPGVTRKTQPQFNLLNQILRIITFNLLIIHVGTTVDVIDQHEKNNIFHGFRNDVYVKLCGMN